MSILDSVRNKYKTPVSETDKGDKRASGTFVSPTTEDSQGISDDHLRLLAGDEWPEISQDPAQLRALRAAAETAAQIQQGIVPEHYTHKTTCRHCGPVPIFPGVPDKVEGCPWCFRRTT